LLSSNKTVREHEAENIFTSLRLSLATVPKAAPQLCRATFWGCGDKWAGEVQPWVPMMDSSSRCVKQHWSLLAIDRHPPKLDVTGSNPVSRSIFSMTYRCKPWCLNTILNRILKTVDYKLLKARDLLGTS
jgi:hypothetical protein